MTAKTKILIGVLVVLIIIASSGWFIWKWQGYVMRIVEVSIYEVSIYTDKTEYEIEETVKITVKNNSNKSIWYKSYDPSSCFPDLKLLGYKETNWGSVPLLPFLPPVGCTLEIKELKKDGVVTFEYSPSYWIDKNFLNFIKYKLSFEYRENKKEGEYKKIYSNEFTIKEKDETANWETYWNEEYGFEIRYPNDWEFELDHLNKKISITLGGETFSPILVIQFPTEKYSEILAKEERNFNEWQQENVEQPSGKINDITFAGIPAKEFLYYSPVGCIEQIIILSKNNQAVVIESFKNSALDPILSTFKFIK